MLKRFQRKKQIEALRPKLYRLAWSWCHDNDLADDLAQNSLLKALSKIDQLRDDKRLEAWLCQILANQFRDHLRARKETMDPDWETMVSPEQTPHDEAQTHEVVARVRRAVDGLKPEFRMVITMVDLMGLSYSEVSMALNIPMGTVMSRVSRGRGQLKKALEEPRGGNVVPMRNHA